MLSTGLWQKVQDRIKRRKGDGSRVDRKRIAEALVDKLLSASTKKITKAQVEAATRQPEPYRTISKSTVTEVPVFALLLSWTPPVFQWSQLSAPGLLLSGLDSSRCAYHVKTVPVEVMTSASQ